MENTNDTILMQANEEEISRFEQIYNLTTEPSFFLFQYDTDIVRMACQGKIDELINPKQSCVLDCSLIQTDNLLIEIRKVISENICELIHIINIEQAIAKYPTFLLILNTERDTIFRDLSVHIVFWTNQFVTNTLQKEAFDFWSWIVFIFMLETPVEFLTERQKVFLEKFVLEDNYSFEITSKDAVARLNELERQWNGITNFSNNPTIKELKDCFTISELYANELIENGNYTKVIIVLKKAILLLENTSLIEELKILYSNLAFAYKNLGNLIEAENLLEKILESDIKKFGELDSNVFSSQSNLATVYHDLGRLQDAKNLLEKALQNAINFFGNFHTEVSTLQSNLALVYKDLGDLQQAKELLETLLKNDNKIFGAWYPSLSLRQSNLALVYTDLGNLQEAKDLLEKALKTDIKNFGEFHPKVALRQSNLATVYQDLNYYEDAKKMFEKAYFTSVKTLGESSPLAKGIKINLNILILEIKEKNK